MNSYLVRVYREEKDNPRNLVGTVEEAGSAGIKAFTNLDELWTILNNPGKRAGNKFRKTFSSEAEIRE